MCKIIKIQEETLEIEHERNQKGKETTTDKPTTRLEDAITVLSEMKLEIRIDGTKGTQIIKNVTLMEEAVRHAKMKGLKNK